MNQYDASVLLAVMRPGIEVLLGELAKRYNDKDGSGPIPSCPSQSHRAQRCIDRLALAIKEKRGEGLTEEWSQLNRERRQLDDFMHVWHTVFMMERTQWKEKMEEKRMRIKLIARPSDAPCCIKIQCVEEPHRDLLVQTDYDWPGVASAFGWSTRSVQRCDECKRVTGGHHNQVVKFCRHCMHNVGSTCHHSGTDGTINCPDCGAEALAFINEAREFIDLHDGDEAEDPGYFIDTPNT